MKSSRKKPAPLRTKKKRAPARCGPDQLYKTLFEQSPIGVLLLEGDGSILEFNEAAHRLFGYSRDVFSSMRLSDLGSFRLTEKPEERFADALASGAGEFEFQHTPAQGVAQNIHVTIRSLEIAGKGVFHAVLLEVTASKRADEALLKTNQTLDALIRYSPLAIILTDVNSIIRVWNSSAERIFGWTEAEALGKRNPIVPADKWEEYFTLQKEVRSGRPYISKELRRQRKDGSAVYLNAASASLHDTDGELAGLFGIFEDITERRQRDEALRTAVLNANEEKAKLEAVISAIGDELVILDPGFKILYQNKPAIDSIGDHRGAICYQAFENRDCICEGCPVDRSFKDGLIHRGERIAASVIGTMHLDITASPLRDASGNVIAVIEMVKDITERKRTEEELYQHRGQLMALVEERTEELKKTNEKLLREIVEREKMEAELINAHKLESLGILAGGIAHDFNNLLTTTLGNISLAMLDLDQKHPAYRQLAAADRAMLRAQDLTQQLLTFSKGGAPVKKTLQLGQLIEEAAGFALRGSRVRCALDAPADLALVDADAGQLSQVLHNLILNADQAMPDGGTISVTCENGVVSGKNALLLQPGKYVKVVVRDSGVGIIKEHLPRIFDPYFTTKQRGSGLGLATTYSIIKKHGGHITAESESGVGTTFTLLLPASSGAAAKAEADDRRLRNSSGRILVMDDEEGVRQTTGEVLTRLGYSVGYAEDGASAILLYQEALLSGNPFHAVIMDLTIPGGMGGKETVKRLLTIDPNLKAIVSSGYSNDPIMSDYRAYGFAAVVSKPYRLKQLSETVCQVINQGDGK